MLYSEFQRVQESLLGNSGFLENPFLVAASTNASYRIEETCIVVLNFRTLLIRFENELVGSTILIGWLGLYNRRITPVMGESIKWVMDNNRAIGSFGTFVKDMSGTEKMAIFWKSDTFCMTKISSKCFDSRLHLWSHVCNNDQNFVRDL